MPGLALSHFLGTAVVVANIRHGIDNHFPVQLQRNAKDAVHRGVVGSQVEEHKLRIRGGAGHAPLLGLEQQGLLLRFLLFSIEAEGLHLGGPGGVVLAQGVALPGGG